MAIRLWPQTLSAARYFYLVATLLLLCGGIGIFFNDQIPRFYAEHVTLPPLARAFGFTCQEDPSRGGCTIRSVVAGGVFDRVGIRADDHLYTDLDDLIYVLDEAQKGSRMELVFFVTKDQSSNTSRCPWFDMKDLQTHPAKRVEAAVCGFDDLRRVELRVLGRHRTP